MKIAAVQSHLIQLRGAERAFLEMVTSLKSRGHDIDVYTVTISNYFLEKFRENDIRTYTLRCVNMKPSAHLARMRSLLRNYSILSLYRLSKRINKGNYDVAFVHHFFSSPIIPFLKIPKVYYCQEPVRVVYEPNEFFIKLAYLPYSYIDKYSVRRANLVLANSDFTREYIYKIYGIFSITNYLGVDIKKFRRVETEKENFILSVGVIHPIKAHDFVLRSLGLIPEQKRPKLIVVGSGSEKIKSYLRRLAENLGVVLEIKENIEDSELVYLYNKAKLTAVAHVMEPFGLTAVESMACGTPVVAVREGGLRESVFDGLTGILTNRDEREFANAIEYVLDNPDVAEKMGKKGRGRVERHFTWEKCARELEKNLRRVII
ncbi:MAG: glycosyltransferase family 4 protein [Archaeoglobaceae archaeon]